MQKDLDPNIAIDNTNGNGGNDNGDNDNPSFFELDARRLLCPLPVIRLQQTISSLEPGTIVHVLATDPGVLYDIPAWCRIHGHAVLETAQSGKEINIKVQVREN